jgi:hypothetical protein
MSHARYLAAIRARLEWRQSALVDRDRFAAPRSKRHPTFWKDPPDVRRPEGIMSSWKFRSGPSVGRGLIVAAGLLAATLPASAQIVFDGNIVFGNNNLTQAGQYRTDNMTIPPCAVGFTTQVLVESTYPNNDFVDPLLTGALNLLSPNWIPGVGSPAWAGVAGHGVTVTVPNDGFFEQTCYTGALDQADRGSGVDWTAGWTYYDSLGTGRTDIPALPIRVLDNLKYFDQNTADALPTTYTLGTDSVYLIRGQVRVQKNAQLVIPAGAVFLGEKATVGTIIVERYGKIFANGTAARPIIMTSNDAPGSQVRGAWGGINLLGLARTNCIATNAFPADIDTCVSEGGLIGVYGGNNDDDDSGSLEYVRVEYAGKEITTDNELNAFTFNGVGRGTRLEYLQAHRCSDDGLEFFGGTAQLKHCLATDGTDDGFDWQLGYRGKAQFVVVRTSVDFTPSQGGGVGQAGDKGIEADNLDPAVGSENALPRSNPTIANFTLIGDRRNGPGGTNGVQLRRGTSATILNSIVYNHKQQGLRITDTSTWTDACNAGFPATTVFCSQSVGVEPIAQGAFLHTSGMPNPFKNHFTVQFSLPHASDVSVRLYDATGRRVATLFEGAKEAGTHTVQWTAGRQTPPGMYFYRVEAAGTSAQGKVVRAN